jgi:hypothetical protein
MRGHEMGIGGHAHTEAGFFSILLTLLIYGIKWIFGLKFPSLILFLPTFIAIFLGFYVILLIVFLIAWGRE